MSNPNQTSINIPQIIAVAVVGFLAIRWFMSKPTNGATPGSSSSSSRQRNAIDPTKIQTVHSMFPQLDQRSIAWDLQRNGGSVEATTERILGGRGLEAPPPSFQPQLPQQAAPATQSSGRSTATASKTNPDLITRYGLQSKVNGKGKEAVTDSTGKSTWSADKGARADALKKRREEMILAARRKMLEKEQQA